MAKDKWHGAGGLSIIKPKAGDQTLGPQEERLILGPFRFVNHDCSPNCQVTHVFQFTGPSSRSYEFIQIPGTYAYMVEAIRDIEFNEPITVSYTNRGYYDPSQPCLCATCNPANPPKSPERRPQVEQISSNKTRRGGVRYRRKKLREVFEEATG
jgi:hypothetical protein